MSEKKFPVVEFSRMLAEHSWAAMSVLAVMVTTLPRHVQLSIARRSAELLSEESSLPDVVKALKEFADE